MYNELKKEDFKETVQELVHLVKIASAVTTVDIPGSGHLMIEALIDELKMLLPKKCENEQETCVPVGHGSGECACQGAVGMTFSDALAVLKSGGRVARKGWNGKDMYVFLADDVEFNTDADISEFYGSADGVYVAPMLVLRTAQGNLQPGWLASQADMLAEDWYIVE